MRKYKIVFAPTAEKQFMSLTRVVKIRVAQAIAKLAESPFLGKQLKGQLKEYRSYRVGDYRVIYFVRQREVQIEIVRVTHRKEAYKS